MQILRVLRFEEKVTEFQRCRRCSSPRGGPRGLRGPRSPSPRGTSTRDTYLILRLPARILTRSYERKKRNLVSRDSYRRIRNYGTRGIGNLFGNYFYTYVCVWGVFLYYDFGNFGVDFFLVFFTRFFFKDLAITIFRFKQSYVFLQ